MDPDVAWKNVLDESLPTGERLEAVEALRGWVEAGGFLPVSYGHTREGFLQDLHWLEVLLRSEFWKGGE